MTDESLAKNMAYWKSLSSIQLGRYAEYVSRLLFAKSGMDVYLPEIDDKGIDFVVRSNRGHFFEIQCKAVRQLNYWYVEKTKLTVSDTRYLCLLLFVEEEKDDPAIFLIPSRTWEKPNALFVDRPYIGKKSAPEWGLQFSPKNMALLDPFKVFSTVEERANKAPAPPTLAVTPRAEPRVAPARVGTFQRHSTSLSGGASRRIPS